MGEQTDANGDIRPVLEVIAWATELALSERDPRIHAAALTSIGRIAREHSGSTVLHAD